MDFKLLSISKRGFFFPQYIIESDGKIIYTIKQKTFSFINQYGFYDSFNTEVLTLKRKFAFFKIKFELHKDGEPLAFIEQTSGPFKNNFLLDSGSILYFMEGNLTSTSFTVFKSEEEIARISRKPFSRKDKFGIAMNTTANQNLVLALTFVIELTRRIKRKRSAA